jgi:hypothetical protein
MKKIILLLSLITTAGFKLIAQDATPMFPSKVCGDDEVYCADVTLDAGIKRLETSSVVTVQSTFGLHPNGSTFFFFGTLDDASGVGGSGDTVRTEIPAAVTPLGTVYPAVDVTTTVGSCSTDANPELCLAKKHCDELNLDSNFIAAQWKCQLPKDFGYVYIQSRLFNEWGTRTTYTITCTGTTTCNKGEGDIEVRSKAAELAPSPNDPARLGFFGITGTVLTIPGGLGKRFFEFFKNTEGTPDDDMRQDCDAGSHTAAVCDFFVPIDNDEDVFLSQIRCFGGCNGMKFNQFLCKNQELSVGDGILFSIKSDNEVTTLPEIRSTEDWKNFFSFQLPGSAFRIDIQAGGDQFVATFQPELAFVIRKTGTFGAGNDDFVKISIRDNLVGSQGGNLDELRCIAEGFREE